MSPASSFPSLARLSAGAHGALPTQGGVSSGQSVYSPGKSTGVVSLHWKLLQCMVNIFPRGTLGAYRAYFSGPQLKWKQKTKQNKNKWKKWCLWLLGQDQGRSGMYVCRLEKGCRGVLRPAGRRAKGRRAGLPDRGLLRVRQLFSYNIVFQTQL